MAAELKAPLDLDKVGRSAANQEEAIEIYTASLFAIRNDPATERAYLVALAAKLGLPPELACSIEATVAGAEGRR